MMICEWDTYGPHLLPSSRGWLIGSNVRDEIVQFVPPRIHHQLPCSPVPQRHKGINMPQLRLSHPIEHPWAVRGGLLWEHVLAAPRRVMSFPIMAVQSPAYTFLYWLRHVFVHTSKSVKKILRRCSRFPGGAYTAWKAYCVPPVLKTTVRSR